MAAPVQHTFCSKNQTWIRNHLVEPSYRINCFLGTSVALLSTPLEALEVVTRVALGIIAFPVAFIKPDQYIKSFIYTPIVGVGNVVKNILVESVVFTAEMIIYLMFTITFLASVCCCCGRLNLSSDSYAGN